MVELCGERFAKVGERGKIMSTSKDDGKLLDVLNDYVESELTPNYSVLRKWVQKYPEFKDELTEFTVAWSLAKNSPPEAKEVTSDTLVLRAMSIVGDRLYAHGLPKQLPKTKLTDFFKEARNVGLNVHMVANKANMSEQMVTKLARCLIDFETIPNEAVSKLSASINRPQDDLREYFRKPPTAPSYARFSAKSGPKPPDKVENFFDAVRNDRTLDDDTRAFWLAFEK